MNQKDSPKKPPDIQDDKLRRRRYKPPKYRVKKKGTLTGKFIPVNLSLVPKKIHSLSKYSQSDYFENWTKSPRKTKENEVAPLSSFQKCVRSSSLTTNSLEGGGLLPAVIFAYKNSLTLRLCPDDIWIIIIEKITKAIAKNQDKEEIRRLFGRTTKFNQFVSINIDSPLADVNFDSLFQSFAKKLSDTNEASEYFDLIRIKTSCSSNEMETVRNIYTMNGFSDYSQSIMSSGSGFRAVILSGTRDDWELVADQLDNFRAALGAAAEDADLSSHWFDNVHNIIMNMIESFDGENKDDWWKDMLYVRTPEISSTVHEGTYVVDLGGWLTEDLLDMDDEEIPFGLHSGIRAIPISLSDGSIQKKLEICAGLTGFQVVKDLAYDDKEIVQPVHGWAVMVSEEDFPDFVGTSIDK